MCNSVLLNGKVKMTFQCVYDNLSIFRLHTSIMYNILWLQSTHRYFIHRYMHESPLFSKTCLIYCGNKANIFLLSVLRDRLPYFCEKKNKNKSTWLLFYFYLFLRLLKILVLKIKENQSRILIGETKNQRQIISCFFFPRHTLELLRVCLQYWWRTKITTWFGRPTILNWLLTRNLPSEK